jgi:hypothetical protein
MLPFLIGFSILNLSIGTGAVGPGIVAKSHRHVATPAPAPPKWFGILRLRFRNAETNYIQVLDFAQFLLITLSSEELSAVCSDQVQAGSRQNTSSLSSSQACLYKNDAIFQYLRKASEAESLKLWGLSELHRYLMGRLPLQGFYLWRHVLSKAPPFILWWPNLETLFVPLHRSFYFIGGLRCLPIQKENSLYIAEEPEQIL